MYFKLDKIFRRRFRRTPISRVPPAPRPRAERSCTPSRTRALASAPRGPAARRRWRCAARRPGTSPRAAWGPCRSPGTGGRSWRACTRARRTTCPSSSARATAVRATPSRAPRSYRCASASDCCGSTGSCTRWSSPGGARRGAAPTPRAATGGSPTSRSSRRPRPACRWRSAMRASLPRSWTTLVTGPATGATTCSSTRKTMGRRGGSRKARRRRQSCARST
mmetsp:Transcript_70208/g.199190  ORF Transcript_70208/g.199190 Transcript_70208/m.199190 type:complete len:222 (-) Transcript_70208:413-1078(-)